MYVAFKTFRGASFLTKINVSSCKIPIAVYRIIVSRDLDQKTKL